MFDKNVTAKAYTTVQTIAAPFYKPGSLSNIHLTNENGQLRTFKIPLPGNFTGTFRDDSIQWRSTIYSALTRSAVIDECTGNQKSKEPTVSKWGDSFFISSWPLPDVVKVTAGLVYDNSGDMTGNYLSYKLRSTTSNDEVNPAVTAYKALNNLCANRNVLQVTITELLMGPFRNTLLALNQVLADEKLSSGSGASITSHETQKMKSLQSDIYEKAEIIAHNVDRHFKSENQLERDIATMQKHMSLYLKDFPFFKESSDNNCAFYV